MDYNPKIGGLAFTGSGLVVGGTTLGPIVLAAVAFGLIAIGALAIRFGFRRRNGQ